MQQSIMESDKSSEALRQELESNSRLYTIFSISLRILTLIGVILAVFLILQSQVQIKNQIEETKHQGVINQQYIRCIVLLPADTYKNVPEKRAEAVDNCAKQSSLP